MELADRHDMKGVKKPSAADDTKSSKQDEIMGGVYVPFVKCSDSRFAYDIIFDRVHSRYVTVILHFFAEYFIQQTEIFSCHFEGSFDSFSCSGDVHSFLCFGYSPWRSPWIRYKLCTGVGIPVCSPPRIQFSDFIIIL